MGPDFNDKRFLVYAHKQGIDFSPADMIVSRASLQLRN